MLDDHIITISHNKDKYRYSEHNDLYHGSDVNIAIASAVTAGGRMCMSQLKNNSEFNLYYSDTDSAIIDQPLNSKFVGNALGQFKLEYEIKRAVFIAPKVYGLITMDDKEVIKVKGITKDVLSKVNFRELESLLYQNASLDLNQNKWFKKIFDGDISITEVAYNLKVTSNKREAIYHNYRPLSVGQSAFIYNDTKPYNYSDIEIE